MNKGYLAGFIEGEGCFMVNVSGGIGGPQFVIGLRDDDRVILEEIKSVLQTNVNVLVYHERGVQHPAAFLSIGGLDDCMRLIEFLDDNPFKGKKRPQYEIWKKAVYYHRRNKIVGRHNKDLAKRKYAQMLVYHNQLRQLKRYKVPDGHNGFRQTRLSAFL